MTDVSTITTIKGNNKSNLGRKLFTLRENEQKGEDQKMSSCTKINIIIIIDKVNCEKV